MQAKQQNQEQQKRGRRLLVVAAVREVEMEEKMISPVCQMVVGEVSY